MTCAETLRERLPSVEVMLGEKYLYRLSNEELARRYGVHIAGISGMFKAVAIQPNIMGFCGMHTAIRKDPNRKVLGQARVKKPSGPHGNRGRKHTPEELIKMSLSHRGDKHPNWKGGIAPLNAIMRDCSEYKLWRKAVYERDHFTCQDCGGKPSGRLNAHHLKHFILCPEERYSVDNGITLCTKCHGKRHRKGGDK